MTIGEPQIMEAVNIIMIMLFLVMDITIILYIKKRFYSFNLIVALLLLIGSCFISMDERIYLINLYDYYGILLTEKQQVYFEDYYFNNLSLSEISDNYEVSRNAIHKQLKDVEVKLNDYERKLKLYEKALEIRKLTAHFDQSILDKINKLI